VIGFESGIYVRVDTCPKAPPPLPLTNGFSEDRAYRVIGIFNPSETSEAYLILVNNQDQIWFISNRHLRFVKLDPRCPHSSIELVIE